MKDVEPSMPKSVNISEADNGFVVSCYKDNKEYKMVYKTMDEAMIGAKEMMGAKTKKEKAGKKEMPELGGKTKRYSNKSK
jgi:hypothetical protein